KAVKASLPALSAGKEAFTERGEISGRSGGGEGGQAGGDAVDVGDGGFAAGFGRLGCLGWGAWGGGSPWGGGRRLGGVRLGRAALLEALARGFDVDRAGEVEFDRHDAGGDGDLEGRARGEAVLGRGEADQRTQGLLVAAGVTGQAGGDLLAGLEALVGAEAA